MDWDNIRIFLCVARCGSLSAAAEQLHLSASTISRHVDELEAQLGARLFARHQTGYRLSDTGQTILTLAEQAEGALDSLQRKANGLDGAAFGTVRVALPENFATDLILPEIGNFQTAYPNLRLEIVTDVRLANLTRREADMALRLVRPESGDLIISRVGEMASALYATRSYLEKQPMSGEAGHSIVGWDEAYGNLKAAQWLAAEFPTAIANMRTTSLLTQFVACRNGVGLAVLPCLIGDRAPELVRVKHPAEVFSQDIWLVIHREIADTARVRAAADFLRMSIQKNRSRLLGSSALDDAI